MTFVLAGQYILNIENRHFLNSKIDNGDAPAQPLKFQQNMFKQNMFQQNGSQT
jgi:hypothetical protein